MVRRRLTRQENRARIREDLIEAAGELLAERGYWKVSLDEIAERAGVTKGAVYSNFENKEDLLREVARRQRVDLDPSILEDRSGSLHQLMRRIGREVARLATSDEVRAVAPRELELATLALTSEKVRGTLAGAGRQQRQALARFLKERAQEQGVKLPLPPLELATIITALRIGLVHQRLLDPKSIPESYFADAFALAVSGSSDRPPTPPKPTESRRKSN